MNTIQDIKQEKLKLLSEIQQDIIKEIRKSKKANLSAFEDIVCDKVFLMMKKIT